MLPKKGGFRGGFTPVESHNESEINITAKSSNGDLYYTAAETTKLICSTGRSVGEITSDILMKAPVDFFNKYDSYVKNLVSQVQNALSEDGNSESIAKSQADPTSSHLKDKAKTHVSLAITRYNDSAAGSAKTSGLNADEIKIVNALVMNELLGLGPLEPLWGDSSITEIIANGPNIIQVEIGGQIKDVKSCHFRDQKHLMELIGRLYKSINKDVTRNDPMVKGRLHDKSRMMAVHPIVAPDGPNFNIRRHSNDYITPEQIIEFDTASVELMEFLGNLIYSDVSYLIIGGTGSGKTTLLDALTAYIRPDKRGITLEDNLEMKPHPNKKWAAAMETISPKPGSINEGGVTMRDLVKTSMQMRPETIIIGEVTDSAAYDLCQALNTGHDGGSTVHANDSEEGMYRLMSLVSQSGLVKEHAAYDLIASAFDIVINVARFPIDGSRKIVSVSEVGSRPITDDEGNKILPLIPLWEFEPDSQLTKEEKKVRGNWVQKNELSERTKKRLYLDLKPQLTWEELCEIAKVEKVKASKEEY